MRMIGPEHMAQLSVAEDAALPTPIPTQIISSDEYFPAPQSEQQREVEARLLDLGSSLARKQGMSRRRFFQTAAGMAASYLVMNEVYGRLFAVNEAEAATPGLADQRANGLKGQMVFDARVGEEGLQAVIIFLQNGVELVIVAAGAAVGHAEKGGRDRVGDIVEQLLAALHQIAGIAFIGEVAIEAGGYQRGGIVWI